MSKEFNWEEAAKVHSKSRIEWMRANYKKPLTEDDFVSGLQTFRHLGKKSSNYQASKLRHQYRQLKKKFDFFT